MKKKFKLFLIFSIAICTLVLFPSIITSLYKIIKNDSLVENTSTSYNNSDSEYVDSYVYDKRRSNDALCFNTSGNVIITIPEFISNMQCKEYTLQYGETLTSIAKKYNSTCPINTSVKLIKEASKITNADSISTGSKIYIPETILKNGYLYTIKYGDTWNELCKDYYPIYNSDCITKLLIFINDLNNNTLPSGTQIYLPNINI